jgi:hypothetical protein
VGDGVGYDEVTDPLRPLTPPSEQRGRSGVAGVMGFEVDGGVTGVAPVSSIRV